MTQHPADIAIPAPAKPLPMQAAAPRGPRSFVVREVGGGWIAQPCEGVQVGPESVAVAPDALAALLRAWAAER